MGQKSAKCLAAVRGQTDSVICNKRFFFNDGQGPVIEHPNHCMTSDGNLPVLKSTNHYHSYLCQIILPCVDSQIPSEVLLCIAESFKNLVVVIHDGSGTIKCESSKALGESPICVHIMMQSNTHLLHISQLVLPEITFQNISYLT